MKIFTNTCTKFLLVTIAYFGTINCNTNKECEENVVVKLKELRKHAQIFKTEVAFDPFDHSITVDRFVTYPNGYYGYTLGESGIGLDKDGVLYSLTTTVNGKEEFTRAEATGEGFYNLNRPDGQIITNFNPITGANSNDPTALKIFNLYKSARKFYKLVKHNKKNPFTTNTTNYEFKDGEITYEETNTLKLVEKFNNGNITGNFECRFDFPGGWGTTSDTYLISSTSNEVELTSHSESAVM